MVIIFFQKNKEAKDRDTLVAVQKKQAGGEGGSAASRHHFSVVSQERRWDLKAILSLSSFIKDRKEIYTVCVSSQRSFIFHIF